MNKKILYGIICVTAIVGLALIIAERKSAQNVRFYPTTEEPTTEEPFTVVTMTFTEDQADEILARIQAEKEEAERQARLKAQIAAQARAVASSATYSPSYFKRAGVLHWGGWRWTWYSERILPGHGLRIPGRHTDAQGYVRDGDGYLCLASDALRRGTVIDTPLGSKGKVYDCGCGMHTIDVYVNW